MAGTRGEYCDVSRIPVAAPPPFDPPPRPDRVTYVQASDFRVLLPSTKRRGDLWPYRPESAAERLNSALHVYATVCRDKAAEPPKAFAEQWTDKIESLVSDIETCLGGPAHSHWIAEQTGWDDDDVDHLRNAIDRLQSGRIKFHWGKGHDPFCSGKSDWPKISLFDLIAPLYQEVYSLRYSITRSPREGSAVSGVALSWTQRLFRLAAGRPGSPPEIRELADWAEEHPQALAKVMKEARDRLVDRQTMLNELELETQSASGQGTGDPQ